MKFHSAINFEEGIKKLDFKKSDLKNEKFIEYESHFGLYINKTKITSNVPEPKFMFVKSVFNERYGWTVTRKKDTVHIKNHPGGETLRKIVDNNQNIKYELKKKLDVVKISELTGSIHYRLVKSQELPMEKEDYDELETDVVVKRSRERVTFEKEGVKLEFTIVNGSTYEIEVEFENENAGKKFTSEVHRLLNFNIKQMNYYSRNIDIQKMKARDTYKKLLDLNKFKFVGPLPQTLTYKDFENDILTKVEDEKKKNKAIYSVTEKADGERFLLLTGEDGNTYLFPRNINHEDDFRKIQLWEDFKFQKPNVNIILDGEFVKNNFYVFDLLVMRRADMRSLDFSERLKELKMFFQQENLQTEFNIHLKNFRGMKKSDISIYQHADTIWKDKNHFPYDLDGLIFTPINEPYYNNKIYKWKEINTIDFATDGNQLFIAGSNSSKKYDNYPFQGPHGNGVFYKEEKGGNLVEKRNLIYDDQSLPEHTRTGFLSPPIKINGNGKIAVGEFEFDTTTKSFNLLKIRYDKQFANNISAVNQVWESASNPISIETLRNGPSSNETGVIEFFQMEAFDIEETLNQTGSMIKNMQTPFTSPIVSLHSSPVSVSPKQYTVKHLIKLLSCK